ncbi:MAG TPA: hypothetical protein VEV44_13760 [Pseudoneobacillus sp.]|nr:hypothetical protein [Pseudoneobacillus sp.]
MSKIKYILGILLDSITPSFEYRSLDTRLVDLHIKELTNHSWFYDIYQDEKYRKLITMNYQTRKYLESPFRVERLSKSVYTQEKFKKFLEKQWRKQQASDA